MNYDITIKSHEKDSYKLDLVLDSLVFLNPQPYYIYIISPNGFRPNHAIYKDKFICLKDDEVTPYVDRSKISVMPNWVWTNLVSLTQNFTENDFYLDVQSDVFFLKKINLFDDQGKPKLFKTTSNPGNNFNRDHPYFKFSKEMFGINKVTDGDSYIIDYTMYNKKIAKKIYDNYHSVDDMLEAAYKIIDGNRFPADGEIFGNFVEKFFPDFYYITREINHCFSGVRSGEGKRSTVLTYIKNCKTNSLMNSCAFHDWK